MLVPTTRATWSSQPCRSCSQKVELPLEPVLAQMEATGIRIDVPYLQEPGPRIDGRQACSNSNQQAIAAAGEEFNLASPKQLGELLFNTLGLDRKKSRKHQNRLEHRCRGAGKTRQTPIRWCPWCWSTGCLSKLKSTYVDALPQLVESGDRAGAHRFQPGGDGHRTALQQQPQPAEHSGAHRAYSRQIRKAFLPQQDWTLLSADYSQIELRILTHLSRRRGAWWRPTTAAMTFMRSQPACYWIRSEVSPMRSGAWAKPSTSG